MPEQFPSSRSAHARSSKPASQKKPQKIPQKILGYRSELQGMQQQLLTENDLRRLMKDETIIAGFKRQLSTMLIAVKKLVNKPSTEKYFVGINTFCTNIDDAITQIDVTLDALEELKKKFDTEIRTQAYNALKNCRALIEEALLQFKIT